MTCDEFRAGYPQFRFPGPASRLQSPEYGAWVGHLDGCRACGDWYQGEEVRARGIELARYPCVHLAYYTGVWFADRADSDRQNVAIVYNPRFDEFGIHLYDRSVLGIRYCPWCGTKTPRVAARRVVRSRAGARHRRSKRSAPARRAQDRRVVPEAVNGHIEVFKYV